MSPFSVPRPLSAPRSNLAFGREKCAYGLFRPIRRLREPRELRARAHHLQPVVIVGRAGLQPPVLAAVSRALRDQELIKVRLHEPEDKHGTAQALADATGAALCGLVGHTVILFKPQPAKQKSKQPHHARRA